MDSAARERYPTPMTWDAELDARGLLCPLPVLKARKRLNALAPGTLLRVLADDPAAAIDIPHFCAETGHALLAQEDLGQSGRAYLIRARPAAQASPRKSSAA